MNNVFLLFLAKIKLIDSLQMNFSVSKKLFIQKLEENIDDDKKFQIFEQFSSSYNDYKGVVNEEGFRLRRRKHFADYNLGLTSIFGRIEDKGEKIKIDIRLFINPTFVLLLLGLFGFFITVMIFNDSNILIFIISYSILLFIIVYIILRNDISKAKKDFEKDLFFYINK